MSDETIIVEAIDMPAMTVSGEVQVLARYTDGYGRELLDLGLNGQRIVCGWSEPQLNDGA